LLRRHEAEGPYDRRADSGRPAEHVAHGAEVDDRDAAVVVEHEVRGLDVAVHDRGRVRVEVLEDGEDAVGDLDDSRLEEPLAPGEPRLERTAARERLREVEGGYSLLLHRERRDVPGDTRMPEHCERAPLALEQLDELPLGEPAEREALERDARAGLRVDGFVRHARAAAAERPDDGESTRDDVVRGESGVEHVGNPAHGAKTT
jgi:hypothetical protein